MQNAATDAPRSALPQQQGPQMPQTPDRPSNNDLATQEARQLPTTLTSRTVRPCNPPESAQKASSVRDHPSGGFLLQSSRISQSTQSPETPCPPEDPKKAEPTGTVGQSRDAPPYESKNAIGPPSLTPRGRRSQAIFEFPRSSLACITSKQQSGTSSVYRNNFGSTSDSEYLPPEAPPRTSPTNHGCPATSGLRSRGARPVLCRVPTETQTICLG